MQQSGERVAWITGAGTGIGEASAVALAEAGIRVVLSGRRRDKLEAVAERIGPSRRSRSSTSPTRTR